MNRFDRIRRIRSTFVSGNLFTDVKLFVKSSVGLRKIERRRLIVNELEFCNGLVRDLCKRMNYLKEERGFSPRNNADIKTRELEISKPIILRRSLSVTITCFDKSQTLKRTDGRLVILVILERLYLKSY